MELATHRVLIVVNSIPAFTAQSVLQMFLSFSHSLFNLQHCAAECKFVKVHVLFSSRHSTFSKAILGTGDECLYVYLLLHGVVVFFLLYFPRLL